MGARTRASIVAAGLSKAGRSDLTTQANGWLNDWLRDTYKSWPWPFLQKRSASIDLAAALSSLDIGAGAGGITPEIITIHDPLYVWATDYSTRQMARLRSLAGGPDELDVDIINPATNRGCPSYFKARPAAVEGKFTLVPDKVTDKAYKLALDYTAMPATLGDNDVPIFPSDRIMVMVVQAEALDHMHKIEASEAIWGKVEGLLLALKSHQGASPGVNDRVELDGDTFR